MLPLTLEGVASKILEIPKAQSDYNISVEV